MCVLSGVAEEAQSVMDRALKSDFSCFFPLRPVVFAYQGEIRRFRVCTMSPTARKSNNGSLRSPLRYPGGKSRVVKRLLEFIPPHSDYREIFAGGAALFFAKERVASSWLNDLHPGLHAFYSALRDSFESFAEACLNQEGNLRDLFDYWAERRDLMESDGDDNLLERAVQFFFINRTVWGGRVVFDPARKSRLYFSNPEGWSNIQTRLDRLRAISKKLSSVKVTCQDFQHCLSNCSGDTFIYADPPYMRDSICHATDKLYDKSFTLACHNRLASVLNNIPAKVMLSYDDCEEVRNLYDSSKWLFIELQWKYCGRYAVTNEARTAGEKEKKVDGKELLILNYGHR